MFLPDELNQYIQIQQSSKSQKSYSGRSWGSQIFFFIILDARQIR